MLLFQPISCGQSSYLECWRMWRGTNWCARCQRLTSHLVRRNYHLYGWFVYSHIVSWKHGSSEARRKQHRLEVVLLDIASQTRWVELTGVFVASLPEAEGRNEDESKSSKSGIIKLDAIREIIDKVSGRGLCGHSCEWSELAVINGWSLQWSVGGICSDEWMELEVCGFYIPAITIFLLLFDFLSVCCMHRCIVRPVVCIVHAVG